MLEHTSIIEDAICDLDQAKTVLNQAMSYFESTEPADRAMLAFYADTIDKLQCVTLHLLCDAINELREIINKEEQK